MNKFKGEIKIEIHDQVITVRPTIEMLAALESHIGSVPAFFNKVINSEYSLSDICSFVTICLRHTEEAKNVAGEKFSNKEISEIMFNDGFGKYVAFCTELTTVALMPHKKVTEAQAGDEGKAAT